MTDSFTNILGQPKVRDFLRSSTSNSRISHAYLFTGPAGSNKTQAAYAFAQAILCPKVDTTSKGGECGQCENCTRAKRRSHPDVHYVAPEGATGYLIDQIRDLSSDISLAPIMASKKVYIIDRADLLGHSASNAFLKTLEEPPDDVVIILMARTRDSVLETIASRCQVVPFRHIPPTEAAGIITQNTGATTEQAAEALEACSGSINKSIEFLKARGNERMFFRTGLLRTLSKIDSLDSWQLLLEARDIVEKSKAPLDSLREKQEEELAKNADFLAKSQIRQIEERNKRRLTNETSEALKQALSIMASWLRDIAVVCAGDSQLVINVDFKDEICALAPYTNIAKVSGALRAIEDTKLALRYNVSPETCLDVAFLKMKEVFNGAGSTC